MLKFVLLTLLTTVAAEYRQENLVVPADSFSDLVDTEEALTAVSNFFSLENAGHTTFGKLMAWKGDLIQPIALFGLGLFALFTVFRYLIWFVQTS